MNPTFSVIIPAFNAAATLARAIESVRTQSWPAHEIIVVDDGSQDATAEIARQFGGNVRLIRQANAGVSVARNAGAAVATGDWLAFLDADDWYRPDRIRLHAEWIAEDANLDCLTGDYEYQDASGTLLGTSMAQHESGRMVLARAAGAPRVVMERPAELAAFVADHFGDTHTLSVPRSRFIKLGGYPTGFKVCEDVHFLTRLVAQSRRIGVICQSLGVYVIHDGSATRRNPVASQRENVRTLTDLMRLANNFPLPVRQGIAARMRNARYNLGCALSKSGRRFAAVNAVLPTFTSHPDWQSLRAVLSMLKG
ncbi:MAG: glycosyltransferase family 2 protein [Thiobacillus sp.]|jgi:glycosyltransferase involved in cell wall biosynthesis|nr:glycosyltransferase family 2 protein [Thiobacillus sp.]